MLIRGTTETALLRKPCVGASVCGLSWAPSWSPALACSHASHHFGRLDHLHFPMTTAQPTSDYKGMGNPSESRQSSPSQIPDQKLLSNREWLLFYDAKLCGNLFLARVSRTPPWPLLLPTRPTPASVLYLSAIRFLMGKLGTVFMLLLLRAKASFVWNLAWLSVYTVFPQI